ncbi:MAG: zf-HC2 domain-containing protein, partial [Planctomycetales bacterium]|nr:zf-HC2 domain-containing protein [Planctomycetales bacterium]
MKEYSRHPPIDAECKWVADRCEAHVDGELTSAERHRLLEHAESCSVCSDAILRAERLQRSLSQLPTLRCPDAVTAAVRRRMQAERMAPRSARRRVLIAAGIAASLALLLTFALQRQQDAQRRRQAAMELRA